MAAGSPAPTTSRRAPSGVAAAAVATAVEPESVAPRRVELFLSLRPAPELVDADGVEGQLLDAARRCMVRYGSAKISVSDVARLAQVSRGTVYNHFADRDRLLFAVNALACNAFAADMDDAMSAFEQLEDQCVAAAVVVRCWERALYDAGGGGIVSQSDFAVLATHGAGPVMRMMVEVITRFLQAAAQRGELRADLRLEHTAEWIARILHSLSANPGLLGLDADDPHQLAEFIRSHLVYGFAARRSSTQPD